MSKVRRWESDGCCGLDIFVAESCAAVVDLPEILCGGLARRYAPIDDLL